MKKRVTLDVFLEKKNYTKIVAAINSIKDVAINISDEEKSSIKAHDCNHDTGGGCGAEEVIL